MRDISREGILLAGAGRALLLQLAHPAVGAGVARHSDFASDPLKRLHGTLTYIYAVASGSEADATAARRYVNRQHAPVTGDGYSATDPHLQLWVAATLYDTALLIHETCFGPLSPDDAERVYREYAVLGTALQMPAELWPSSREAFREYFDSVSLDVSDDVRAIAHQLLHPVRVPLWVKIAMPTARTVTSELLPSAVRAMYGLPDGSGLDRVIRIYRLMPGFVRHWPQRHYLRRLRIQSAHV
jgi:uncharacterized protein (DUF2236 family)